MMHKPIQIKNLSLSFPHKVCFEHFDAEIHAGSRIAIIGSNGSGKSTLLNGLKGDFSPCISGDILIPNDVILAHVPQIITDFDTASGAERFHKALTQALNLNPNVLLLDEPTNHLDRHRKQNFLHALKHYPGTLIIVSHDTELLRNSVNTVWHIIDGNIRIFSGDYDDYQQDIALKRIAIIEELSALKKQKKEMHLALMQEQVRAAKSKAKGEKSIREHKWPLGGKTQALRAEKTSGKKKMAIEDKKKALNAKLSALRLPDKIIPNFSLAHLEFGNQVLVSITNGSISYVAENPLLQSIYLTVHACDRIAIIGDNGSGKSTLVKAILDESNVIKTGDWLKPCRKDIGYLDQHYSTLCASKSVLETISSAVPTWDHATVRKHLNDFLFRNNEEVYALVSQLSGGEKVRLCLALIAATPPKLLILDEITNNLDLETKAHITAVLSIYPGALLVISHDEDFLKAIGIQDRYVI